MNRYEGLNLPQLLDLMHELVLPEPVSWMPQTVGWPVIVVWLIAVVLSAGWYGFKRWQKNRYRREALAELESLKAQAKTDPSAAAGEIAALVKRTALAAFPRQTVANLHSADWARFLCESAGNDAQVEHAAAQIAVAAYRTDVDGNALIAPARRWIEVHRA